MKATYIKQLDAIQAAKDGRDNVIDMLRVAVSVSLGRETTPLTKEELCEYLGIDPAQQPIIRVGFMNGKTFESIIPTPEQERDEIPLQGNPPIPLVTLQSAMVELQVGTKFPENSVDRMKYEVVADSLGENAKVVKMGITIGDNFTEKGQPTITIEGFDSIQKINAMLRNGVEACLANLQAINTPTPYTPKIGDTPHLRDVPPAPGSSLLQDVLSRHKKAPVAPKPLAHGEASRLMGEARAKPPAEGSHASKVKSTSSPADGKTPPGH